MTDYRRLYELQDKLIEHKYPVQGVWEYEISNAGDIFRGLSKDHPDSGYVCQKVHALTGFIEEQPLNKADFEDFAYYTEGGYFREHGDEKYSAPRMAERKDRFMKGLAELKRETAQTVDDSERKKCLLDSLDLIHALTQYYEKSPAYVPKAQWSRLKRSVNQCLETPCRKQRKGKRIW